MLNFQNRYKNKKPEETINIIQKFFNNRGYIIKRSYSFHSEIDTYSCSYQLFYHNNFVLKANGKGYTPIYAQASCYAELYERFCAYTYSNILNPIVTKDMLLSRKKEYGYYLCPGEKELTIEDLLNDPYASLLFEYLLPNKEEKYIEQFKNIFFDNQLYGMPFQSINNSNNIKYFNLSLAQYATDTTGLAAGNTLEEALIQGSSEIYERICTDKFFSDIQDKYYYLDYNDLDISIQQLVANIQNLGYNVYTYDLSYNFNLPVCLTIAYDLYNGIFQLNFGSFPIIDIAVERTLTELYQGLITFPNNTNLIYEYNIQDADFLSYTYSLSANINNKYIVPQYVFNSEQKMYNKKYFLNIKTDYNDSQLLEHIKYINICNNLNFYYFNISLKDDFYAVAILSDKIIRPFANNYQWQYLKKFSKHEKEISLIIMQYFKNWFCDLFKYMSTESITEVMTKKFLVNLLYLFQQTKKHPIDFLNSHSQLKFYITHLLYPFEFYIQKNNDCNNLFYILMDQYQKQLQFQSYGIYRNKYIQYKINSNINKKLFKNTYEIPKNLDLISLFKFLFLDSMHDIYTSDIYKQFINTLINKNMGDQL